MSAKDLIENLISVGVKIQGTSLADTDYLSFVNRVRSFIQGTYDISDLRKFEENVQPNYKTWTDVCESHGRVLGYLEGLLTRYSDDPKSSKENSVNHSLYDTTKVFIVHGHDSETKETVARFIQKVGLKPIILHEQPSSGLTIIEKLESYSNVGFAVVLLTPDDIGGLAKSPDNLQKRARQNVILELGYFIGKLSRNRICALYKQGVEIPSDYGSVVFIELDEKGGWRTKLAQEFVHAGMSIEISGLLEA
ncbi:hypothetical protein ANRL3_02448 [Anaerolineae bacterium]|nr:hypothetical protein ANRL3_02448 [Anaerolineae bacterium]